MKVIKPIKKEKPCTYQYYDKQKGIMTECGKQAVATYGNIPLCRGCTEFVLNHDRSCRHLNHDGKVVKSILGVL